MGRGFRPDRSRRHARGETTPLSRLRNNGMMEKVFEIVPRDEVFGYTGIQMMQINALYQLYAAKLAKDPPLDSARHLL